MNALVIKTGKIVNIVDKKGEHYLDNNYNPYKKEELEFFIKQNNCQKRQVVDDDDDDDEEREIRGIEMNGQFMSFEEFNRLQVINSHVEKCLWLAASVIEQHPDFHSHQVAEFCLNIYRRIRDNLMNG